jgi:ATP-dependent RNA helicase SUPV3L1/SUV3
MSWKKISALQRKYDKEKNMRVSNEQYTLQKEREQRLDLKRLARWIRQLCKSEGAESERVRQAEALRAQIQASMRYVSEGIFHDIKQKYGFSACFSEVLSRHEKYYYHGGIVKTLYKKGIIQECFRKALWEAMPEHPKDEYCETRAIHRKFYIHAGPTNSGKTHAALQVLQHARNGAYLAPLRLLALEVYERLNEQHIRCNLLTGEEEIYVEQATHVACTVEKVDVSCTYDVVVIDECQMVGDTQRGWAWSRAILGIKAQEIHLCCSPEAVDILCRLIDDCEDRREVIYHDRQTPLLIEEKPYHFPRSVEAGDALIVFSRRMALQVASALAEQTRKASVIYGNLPPETRRKQVRLFQQKENEVLVATDAIGMGLNLPIRRIVFLETEKFDGDRHRPLKPEEVKQIAGRAGRQGMYEEGRVNATSGKNHIKQMLKESVRPITQAYIAPIEQTILSLPIGSLYERLQAWENEAFVQPYFAKMDISPWLDLLKVIEKYENQLSPQQLYRAISIPFHQYDSHLMNIWLSYVNHLVRNETKIPVPIQYGKELDALERYYRALNLYYAWNLAFGLPFDLQWVQAERARTAEDIHQVLKNDMKKFRKKCSACGKPMPWNAIHGLCDPCFSKRYSFYWDDEFY